MDLVINFQISPIILANISFDFEKQIVLRVSLLSWGRKFRLCCSIRWVYFLLITWLIGDNKVRYIGHVEDDISRAKHICNDVLSDTVISIKQPVLIAFIADIQQLLIAISIMV